MLCARSSLLFRINRALSPLMVRYPLTYRILVLIVFLVSLLGVTVLVKVRPDVRPLGNLYLLLVVRSVRFVLSTLCKCP